MKFKLLWMPVNNLPAETTWEPWKALRTTAALHRYLADHNMRALIPKIYKD
jgi:hypothetical protein